MTTQTKPLPYTRVTTIANTLADRYGLEQWDKRNVAFGMGQREDLYALAASTTLNDKAQLNKIVKQAQEAAKSRSGANLGTALHKITERIDAGEILDVPAQWRPDVDAYCQTLADYGVRIHSDWIERVAVIPEMGAAGTVDRMVTVGDNLTYHIADLKTGSSAPHYANETAIQLALYANATHAWRGTTDEIERDQYGRYLLPDPEEYPDAYDPMPPVNKQVALMIHLPVQTGECNLYEVDIASGIVAAGYAQWVREWRKRKDLASPYNPPPFGRSDTTTEDDDW